MKLLFAFILFSLSLSAQKVALVIGVKEYDYQRELPGAEADALRVARALSQGGFKMLGQDDSGVCMNPTKKMLSEKLEEFFRAGREAEFGCLYFAGHGVQHNGRTFLLPKDVELEKDYGYSSLRKWGVEVNDIAEACDELRFSFAIICDSCRNEFGVASKPELYNPRQGLVIYSTTDGKTAKDIGPFTSTLVENWQNGETMLASLSNSAEVLKKQTGQELAPVGPFTCPIAKLTLSAPPQDAGIKAPEPKLEIPPVFQDGWLHDAGEAIALSRSQSLPLLIFFDAGWCPYCRQFRNEVISTSGFANWADGYILLRLAFEKNDDSESVGYSIANSLGVTGYPSVVCLDTEGNVLGRADGYRSGSGFAEWVKRIDPQKEKLEDTELEIYSEVRKLTFDHGYDVLDRIGLDATVLKSLTGPAEVNVKARRIVAGREYYLSDWSQERRENGENYFWMRKSDPDYAHREKIESEVPAIGEAGYMRDENGIRVWNNQYEKGDRAKWSGESDEAGFAVGEGTLTWLPSMRKYTGTMVDGKFDGPITLRDSKGYTGEGQYDKGLKSGTWTIRKPSGGVYRTTRYDSLGKPVE